MNLEKKLWTSRGASHNNHEYSFYVRRLFYLASVQHASSVAYFPLEFERRGCLDNGTLEHTSRGVLIETPIISIHNKK